MYNSVALGTFALSCNHHHYPPSEELSSTSQPETLYPLNNYFSFSPNPQDSFLFSFFIFKRCSVVDLRCCVSFSCTATWLGYTHVFVGTISYASIRCSIQGNILAVKEVEASPNILIWTFLQDPLSRSLKEERNGNMQCFAWKRIHCGGVTPNSHMPKLEGPLESLF